MAGPYGALWPCLFRDSGVVGCTAAAPHPIAVGTVLVGAVLAGFWESAFFMAGFWESVVLGPAPWSRLSHIFLGGGF